MKPDLISFTRNSENGKTGNIPVTTSSRTTCPPSCKFYKKCYPEVGYRTRIHWNKVTDGERGISLDALANRIARLPAGQLWRHNIAGDLPGSGERINGHKLRKLVSANRGKKGWTYTHKRPEVARNSEYIKEANDGGFTINLSANNLAHADRLLALGIAPVVSVVPEWQTENTVTPAGNRVVICPAAVRDDVQCASCGLCQRVNRQYVIAFPAHGSNKKAISALATVSGGILYEMLWWVAAFATALLVVIVLPVLLMFL